MKRSLVRVATPESAQKILFRLLKDSKITVEDIDKESPSSALLRQTAAKYYPEIKLKPHVNLLRTNEPVEEIKFTEERDFSPTPRSLSEIQRKRSQVLLPETQEDSSSISVEHLSW